MMNTRLQNRLTESEILKIFSDVVEAVCWMHTREPPLAHRDLKVRCTRRRYGIGTLDSRGTTTNYLESVTIPGPADAQPPSPTHQVENILLSASNLYKLCDFGSTTSPKPYPPQSMQEIQMLEAELNKHTTLQYRAPEMCDVWSRKGVGLPAGECGCLLCTLLLRMLTASLLFLPDDLSLIRMSRHLGSWSSSLQALLLHHSVRRARPAGDPQRAVPDARLSSLLPGDQTAHIKHARREPEPAADCVRCPQRSVSAQRRAGQDRICECVYPSWIDGESSLRCPSF